MALTYNEDGTTSYSIAERNEKVKKESKDNEDKEKIKKLAALQKRTPKKKKES